MIRIKETDGTTVDTIRHTFEQATAARDAGIGIPVGGPDDVVDFDRDENGADIDVAAPERVIYPQGIASIDQVPW